MPPHSSHHILLDLETLALTPDAIICSIGAVCARIENGQAQITSRYYRQIDWMPQAGKRALCLDTLDWWQQQNETARREALAYRQPRTPLWLALRGLNLWLHINPYPIWGNGSDFDNTILQHAYRQHGMKWPFWRNSCLRSLKNLASQYGNSIAKLPWPSHLRKHVAIDDAEHEAAQLAALLHQLITPAAA